MSILRVEHLSKTYRLRREPVPVLRDLSLEVRAGEWLAVLGSSGSGKSTLLHLLGGLDRPDKRSADGRAPVIEFQNQRLEHLSQAALDRYRSRDVGFVFQFYHLIPELTVLENVLLGPMIRRGRFAYAAHKAEARDRARGLLETVGLSHRLGHRPAELSGGERQRVAIARALINGPKLLLADEPTGNLDRATGQKILDAVASLRAEHGLTMVMVTHDPILAERADRILRLDQGRLAQGRPGAPSSGERSSPGSAPPGLGTGLGVV